MTMVKNENYLQKCREDEVDEEADPSEGKEENDIPYDLYST